MIFLIVVGVVLLSVLLGLLFAFVSARLDTAVAETTKEVESKDKGVNPALTLGYEIPTDLNPDEQIKHARILAARQAARLPRGANATIGHKGESKLQTAWQGVERDPFTAAKIAKFHGWQGVKSGVVFAPVAAAAAPAAVAPTGKITLVPGKDYPVIEITDSMSDAEKRKARIANSKAKSAAMKAAKAAGAPAGVAAAPAAAAAVPAAAAPAVNVESPQLIEITDAMSPDEKRKARIANSKAKSAYNKALKAAGVSPQAATVQPAAAAAPAAAPAAAAVAPAASTANLPPKPELTELTDDMSADEKRKARIANSKAKSAYNKALKAAGIDPKSVQW